jgi:hypothetical protein
MHSGIMQTYDCLLKYHQKSYLKYPSLSTGNIQVKYSFQVLHEISQYIYFTI